MKVKCKVTGKYYDPVVEFDKILSSPEIRAVLKRLKYK